MSTGSGGSNMNNNNNNSNPDSSSGSYTSGVFFGVFVFTLIAVFLYLCLRRCQRRRVVSAAVNRGALSSPSYFPEFYSGVRIEDIDELQSNRGPVVPARWPPPATTAFTLKDSIPSSNTTVVLPPPTVHITIDPADIPTQAPPAYIVPDKAFSEKEGLTIVTTRDKDGADQVDYVHTPSKSRREVLKGAYLETDNPFFDPPSYGSRSQIKHQEQRHEENEEKEDVIELQDVHVEDIQDEPLE